LNDSKRHILDLEEKSKSQEQDFEDQMTGMQEELDSVAGSMAKIDTLQKQVAE